ncbi:DUF397 domain-containing protein [Streptomyces sp. NPDC002888]|uniref:DUF397 domain-containing protein n=1 Tax=Streptomyces sp. NPDC002888 TaxID=3364668 RepID=UPI0036A94704
MGITFGIPSNDGPDCVEVAIAPADATVHVRDSKDKRGAGLALSPAAWTDFVTHVTR